MGKLTIKRGMRRIALRKISAQEAGRASGRARRKKRNKKLKQEAEKANEAERLKNGLYGVSETKTQLLKKAKHINLTSSGAALCPKCKVDRWAYVETRFLRIPVNYFVCMECGYAQQGHHKSWVKANIEFKSIEKD